MPHRKPKQRKPPQKTVGINLESEMTLLKRRLKQSNPTPFCTYHNLLVNPLIFAMDAEVYQRTDFPIDVVASHHFFISLINHYTPFISDKFTDTT